MTLASLVEPCTQADTSLQAAEESAVVPHRTAAADIEMQQLVERAQALVLTISEAALVGMIDKVANLFTDLQVRYAGDDDYPEAHGEEDNEGAADASSALEGGLGLSGAPEGEGEEVDDDDDGPPSPMTSDRRQREAWTRRRTAASRRQRAQGLPRFTANAIVCTACRDGGTMGDGSCLAKAMLDNEDIIDIFNSEVPEIDGMSGDARDDACSRARHACYRKFIAWKFADPLGSGVRRRIPDCCVWHIRDTFPDSRCGHGCDMLRCCERAGHFVGFKTAASSRRKRKADEESTTLVDPDYLD